MNPGLKIENMANGIQGKPLNRALLRSNIPSGAKARSFFGDVFGSTKVVPCYKTFPVRDGIQSAHAAKYALRMDTRRREVVVTQVSNRDRANGIQGKL
jgi:hypothetical protein